MVVDLSLGEESRNVEEVDYFNSMRGNECGA